MRARIIVFGFLILFPLDVPAQSEIGVEVDEVVDNRLSKGLMTGELRLQVKLTGSGLDRIKAARVIVKEARDDIGTDLTGESKAPDFRDRDVNNGLLELSLNTPARSAGSVRVKGSVELFVPARDPGATIRIPNALAKLDSPFASKALKAEKLSITPLSRERHAAERKKRKITDEDIRKIRAEGKAAGADEKQIELAIELGKTLEEMGNEPVPEGAVILSGSTKDFDRIQSVDLFGGDGQPVNVSGRTTTSKGGEAIMILQPSEALPPDAALQLTLLTSKSRLSVPFELKKVELP